jgi:hypothetical protein
MKPYKKACIRKLILGFAVKHHNAIISSLMKYVYIPGEYLSATQKSWSGLGSEAMAPQAIKARRTK